MNLGSRRTRFIKVNRRLCRIDDETVRLGEYVAAGVLSNPLMTMGLIDPLHIRVDIDEADAWRVRSDSPAIARLRGNPAIAVTLLRSLRTLCAT
jgi:hypothetical protein